MAAGDDVSQIAIVYKYNGNPLSRILLVKFTLVVVLLKFKNICIHVKSLRLKKVLVGCLIVS